MSNSMQLVTRHCTGCDGDLQVKPRTLNSFSGPFIKPLNQIALLSSQDESIEGRRRHNAYLPIHRITTDIFATIITLDHHESSPVKFHSYLRHLRLVCTTWTQVLKANPSLWRAAHSSLSTRMLGHALSMSKGCTLDVAYGLDSIPSPLSKQFEKMVTAYVDEWRSLRIVCRPGNEEDLNLAQRMLKLPAHQVESLYVVPSSALPDLKKKTAFFNNRNPPAREVVLHDCNVPFWKSSLLSDLQTLILVDVTGPTLSADRILDILKDSPRLATLDLSFDTCHASTKHFSPTSEKIKLLSLTSLSLRLFPHDAAHDILSAITFPSCRTLTCILVVGVSNSRTTKTKFEAVTELISAAASAVVASADQLKVSVQREGVMFTVTREGPGKERENVVEIAVMGDWPTLWTSRVERFLSLADLKSSSLSLHILDDLEPVKLSATLRLLQTIQLQTMLKITCSKPRSDAAQKSIQLLATPAQKDGNWHMPNLHTLLLFGYATKLDFVVSMIKKRYSSSGSASRPIALETLMVKGPVDFTGTEKRVIEGLLGKTVFLVQVG